MDVGFGPTGAERRPFESHIFDLAAASAYKENRHSSRMAVNNKHIDNLISNIREHSSAGRAPDCLPRAPRTEVEAQLICNQPAAGSNPADGFTG